MPDIRRVEVAILMPPAVEVRNKNLPGTRRGRRQVIDFVRRPRYFMQPAATVFGSPAIKVLRHEGFRYYDGEVLEQIPESVESLDDVDMLPHIQAAVGWLDEDQRAELVRWIQSDAPPPPAARRAAFEARLAAATEPKPDAADADTPGATPPKPPPKIFVDDDEEVPTEPAEWINTDTTSIREVKAVFRVITGESTRRDWDFDAALEAMHKAAISHDPVVRVWDPDVFFAIRDERSVDELITA